MASRHFCSLLSADPFKYRIAPSLRVLLGSGTKRSGETTTSTPSPLQLGQNVLGLLDEKVFSEIPLLASLFTKENSVLR